MLWALLARREPPNRGPNVTLTLPPQLDALLQSMLDRDLRRRISIEGILSHLPGLAAEARATDGSELPGWLKAVGGVAAGFGVVAVLGSLFEGTKG